MSQNNRQDDFRWDWLKLIDADSTLSGNAHHVAYVLAVRFINRNTQQAFMFQPTLARAMHRSVRVVGDALRELVGTGYLKARTGPPARGRGLVYTVSAPRAGTADSADSTAEASRP
jgi:hypothetical protein